jgi:superfamily I DNA and/or RNA helicase
MTESTTADYFARQLELLELEARAEQERLREQMQSMSAADAERSGNSLVQLVIRDEYAGMGGRVLVRLAKRNQQERLPWTQLKPGTPVLLTEQGVPDAGGWRGVVSDLRRDSIQVALDTWPDPQAESATFRLDLAADEVARRRQRAALEQAAAVKSGRLVELRAVLLEQQPPHFHPEQTTAPLDPGLNAAQVDAVRHALAAADLAVIHGPPGTGKTTTVVELIRQAVRRGERVLACAPSNLAVDNIFERLLAAGESAVRLGHPARVLPELRAHTLELQVENHPEMRLVRNLMKDAYALRNQAGKWTRAKPAPGARREMREEAKAMLADARRLESQLVERVLDGARVVCATTTGLSENLLGERTFDLCVIDEAGQSTEPGCWNPILRSGRVVLAGDPFQLPPTVVSPKAVARGFNVSMLERLMRSRPEVARILDVQYRMHREIMGFSSAEFYEKVLAAAPAVAEHRLCDLPGVRENALTTAPVTYIDTAGAGYDEALEPDGESRLNEGEAALVKQKVDALLGAGVPPADIAVISPYAAQVRLLREMMPAQLDAGVDVNSVDGFQGRESEVVIISLVRANLEGDIGFLADTRRMNVALTRARRALIVIGDSATIAADPFYMRLLDYFEEIGAYRTVWEERVEF